jgi:hypothetical protein
VRHTQRFTPRVSQAVHLFIAPFLWTVVGMSLIERGLNWMGLGISRWLLLLALLLGTIKSLMVLDRSAKKGLERIKGFGERTCIGAVYPWKTWLLVLLMMASGLILRHLIPPGLFLGTIYCALGWGLLLSSRHGWIQWLHALRLH